MLVVGSRYFPCVDRFIVADYYAGLFIADLRTVLFEVDSVLVSVSASVSVMKYAKIRGLVARFYSYRALGSLPEEEDFASSIVHEASEMSSADVVDQPKKKGCQLSAAAAAVAAPIKESDGAEVRPSPGLVGGLEELLVPTDDGADNDQIISVGCGTRYTLAVSRAKRAYVWGQVSPSCDSGMQGRSGECGYSSGKTNGSATMGQISDGDVFTKKSFSCPRELDLNELMRWREGAPGGRECPENEGRVKPGYCAGDEGDVSSGSSRAKGMKPRWRVAAAGCGPWYIVLALEEASATTALPLAR